MYRKSFFVGETTALLSFPLRVNWTISPCAHRARFAFSSPLRMSSRTFLFSIIHNECSRLDAPQPVPSLLRVAIHVEACYSASVSRGGPRVKHQIERPISDVVVTENLIGSLT